MIADGMRCGVCVRTPDMGWLRARGGPLWYRRYLPLALLLLGGAGAVASLAATVRALSFRAEGSYDPPGPSTGVARSLARQWSIPLFAGGCALTFLLAGAAPQVLRGRRLKRRTWLVLHGRRIDTELLGVGRNALALWGDEHPYRIYSQWRDPRTGLVYQFHSVDLWVEPSAWLPRGGIPVRIDPANPKRYEMDLGFVPAEIHEG